MKSYQELLDFYNKIMAETKLKNETRKIRSKISYQNKKNRKIYEEFSIWSAEFNVGQPNIIQPPYTPKIYRRNFKSNEEYLKQYQEKLKIIEEHGKKLSNRYGGELVAKFRARINKYVEESKLNEDTIEANIEKFKDWQNKYRELQIYNRRHRDYIDMLNEELERGIEELEFLK